MVTRKEYLHIGKKIVDGEEITKRERMRYNLYLKEEWDKYKKEKDK